MRNPRTPHTAANPPHYYWNEPTGLVAWDDPANPRLAPGKLKATPTLVTATMQPTVSCTICAMVFYDLDVRQLRHHFGSSFTYFSALYHPTRGVDHALLRAHTDRVLIGACNPML